MYGSDLLERYDEANESEEGLRFHVDMLEMAEKYGLQAMSQDLKTCAPGNIFTGAVGELDLVRRIYALPAEKTRAVRSAIEEHIRENMKEMVEDYEIHDLLEEIPELARGVRRLQKVAGSKRQREDE